MNRTSLRWLSTLLLLCGFIGPATWAAGLQISPVSITIDSDRRADELWLRNTSDETIHAQVRVYHWSQADGQDVLKPDNALVASPPIVQIAAGQRQLVRIVRTGALAEPAPQERSYRMLVDELPIAHTQSSKASLNFVFRYSIPVFILGTAEQKPQLDWQVLESGGQSWLSVRNSGTRHSQLADVAFAPPGGQPKVLLPGLAGYVLAGMQRQFQLPLPPQAFRQGGTFTSLANGSAINAQAAPINRQP